MTGPDTLGLIRQVAAAELHYRHELARAQTRIAELAVQARDEGATVQAIAEAAGRKRPTIYGYVHRHLPSGCEVEPASTTSKVS